MSGPRVTSGADSKQDYATPPEFMEAVRRRFGPLSFDLAAHAGNKQHARYFAPTHFVEVVETKVALLTFEGGYELGVERDGVVITGPVKRPDRKRSTWQYEKRTRNDDPGAYGKDAFAHSWGDLSRKFGAEHPTGAALLWDNCEFNDIPRWAARHLTEMADGANSLLLTPLTTANWFRDFMAGRADVYDLAGRLSFDGKNVFAKDCMLSHYHPGAQGRRFLWDWQEGRIRAAWSRA